ncbi:hypothetical protein [Parabacteroides goldsteinii]|uniref:Uncharacterized protein n=1 Tax=Parabacteroides goldsteinii DSM 19448 = WAL 12034 TaxID=927665 RepID=A0A0F5ITI4_9BACT|nr:hypothetical protein [Parabacteroides goldsteinii]KKB48803.1 hypothetical protein HMPREF1535_04032 [Parabacteroides goldsteinii DSM 19448 = WAL 12034]
MKFSLFILIFLFFANCSSRKHTASFCQQTDSLLQTSRLTVQTARIPESRADLSIPVATLKELPTGAAFIQKSGQATAEIRFLHDTLFVAATCDSLQELVYQYETTIEQLSKQTTQKEKNNQRNCKSGYIIIGFIIICALLYIFRKRWG